MMKKILLKALLIFVLTGVSMFAQKQESPTNSTHFKIKQKLIESKDYLAKTIICKVKPEHANRCSASYINHPQLISLLNTFQTQDLAKKYPHHTSPLRKVNSLGQAHVDLSLIYELKYSGNVPLEKAINKLLSLGIFEYAEPHYLPQVEFNPNDPLSDSTNQYHLDRIEAYKGWDISQGDTNVVIGIVDTGTDPAHEDLSGNIKYNYADPMNGIDDDHDGYIDNFRGYDLGMLDNNPTFVNNEHGVHVSGIAAASTNNNIGVAGVGFKCKFLPVKVAEDAGGSLIAAYEGIVYAADHGAQIINCSWGGTGAGSYGQDVINYASINKGALVIAAAGNEGLLLDYFPAAYNNAISVASTTSDDKRSTFSNYNFSVDVCAPGSQINSTWPGNQYQKIDGTSMASPCAAGVAAIIKSHFPTYTGLQVGEQLKATTDNIYSLNPAIYKERLGTGRVNLYKALTQLNNKSIVMTSRAVVDSNDNVFIVGDTLFIRGVFTNFLSPVSNAIASLKTFSGGNFLTQVDTLTTLGSMATLAQTNNYADPFKFVIKPGMARNQQIVFKLRVADGTYSANYYFALKVNVDYINVTVNEIATSVTSNGKIGFNQDQQQEGLGFKYNNLSLLYEAGLMVGTSPAIVSDCIRGENTTYADTDFVSVIPVREIIPHVKSEFDLNGTFNDASATPTQNLLITQNTYAWSTPGNTKYVVAEFLIKNNGNSTLNNLFAGVCADWDIDELTYTQDKSDFDKDRNLGYTWSTKSGSKYAGVQLLTGTAPPVFYAIDNDSTGDGGVNLFTNGFTTEIKYTILSTQRWQAGTVLPSGNDVLNVMSSGPFVLKPGDTARVAFALMAGESLSDIQKSADSAQVHYGVYEKHKTTGDSEISIYPNPSKDNITFVLNNFVYESGSINLFDILGQNVQTIILNKSNGGLTKVNVDAGVLQSGTYFYRIEAGDKNSIGKIIISR